MIVRTWWDRRRASALVAVTGLALAGATVVLGGPARAADTAPSFEPDPNAVGTVTLYDDAGNRLTSGSTSSYPFATYFAASGPATPGSPAATTAQAVAATPRDGVNSQNWSNDTLSAGTSFGTADSANYPGPLKNSPNAIAVATPNDFSLDDYIGEYPAASTANPGVYQIRVSTGNPANFYAMDVKVTGKTWVQVYPTVATATATAVSTPTANPSSPAPHGATVTLSATVSAADGSHPAGTVRLRDGSTDLGAATFNAATGAVTASVTPADGDHSYTFAFAPSGSAYAASTSGALRYTVSAVTATTTTLAVTPTAGSTAGQSVTLTATVTPSAALGTVTFRDGGVALGAPVAVSGGTASYSTTGLSVATHGLTAVFAPSNTAAYSGSTSSTVSYTVAPKPATTTTTTLAPVTSPVAYGATVSLSASVSPTTAVGSVQFLDGTTVLGTGTAGAKGTYTFATSGLAAGPHSLTAKFVPTDATKFGASNSNAASLTVSAQPTTTAITAPASVDQNAPTTLTARVAPTTATGSVTFRDGGTTLGSAVVSSGVATLSVAFTALGDHTVTATFTPTDTSRFAASTSTGAIVTVNKPAPGTTTLTIAANPTSVVQGATVTLTAGVTPSSATGSVQFLEGTTPLGSPVTVTNGRASYASRPAVGSHTVHAVFTPDAAANLTGSTSADTTYTVKAPPTTTATALTVAPTGTVDFGAALTFTATVTATTAQAAATPAAAATPTGTVTFRNGTTTVGSAAVTNGVARLVTSSLPAGPYSMTATFGATDPSAFAGSASAAVTGTVKPQPTTTAVGTSPAGTVAAGAAVTVTATVTPSTAAGQVTFRDGSTTLGTAPVAGGKATLSVSTLAVGAHQLSAVFSPTSTTAFAGSTSAAVSLQVMAAPVITGVTARGATLAERGTVTVGTSLQVSGAHFVPGETVSLLLGNTVLTTAVVKAGGTVTATATVPAGTSGAVVLTLRGQLAAPTFTVTVTAAAGGAPAGSGGGAPVRGGRAANLASTGADVIGVSGLGLLLAGLGVGFVALARRRGARHAA